MCSANGIPTCDLVWQAKFVLGIALMLGGGGADLLQEDRAAKQRGWLHARAPLLPTRRISAGRALSSESIVFLVRKAAFQPQIRFKTIGQTGGGKGFQKNVSKLDRVSLLRVM